MVKKFVAVALCGALAISLAACGNKDYFAPQIAVEQVLDNIQKASASANGTIDLDAFQEETVVSETVELEEQEGALWNSIMKLLKKPSTPSKNNNKKKDTSTSTETSVETKPETSTSTEEPAKEETVKEEPVKEETTTSTETSVVNSTEEKKDETASSASNDESKNTSESGESTLESANDKKAEEGASDSEPKQDDDNKKTEGEIAKNPEADNSKNDSEITEKETEEPQDNTPETYSSVTLLLINECGAEIKVLSVINPKTGEQVNLGTLGVDEMFILKVEWPSKAKNFRIAAYGSDGTIIMEKALDFTGITTSAAVVLEGTGSLENISHEVE